MSSPVLSGEVLLSGNDVANYRNGLFPADAFGPLLDSKRQDPNIPNGVLQAVRLLLTHAAVAIQFVNTDSVTEPYYEGELPTYTRASLLAYNDHLGGSESNFIILVNRHGPDGDPAQHVLFSPPNEDGTPSNTVFHRADRTFLDFEPRGLAVRLPNPGKTGDASTELGRKGYEHFLFGNTDTLARFSQVLEEIGFMFDNAPYDREHVLTLNRLRDKTEADHIKLRLWPQNQFAGQLVLLDALEQSQT